MGGTNAGETERLILDAIAKLQRPAIVQAGYAGLLASAGSAAKDVLAVGHVPHDYLFARASCVVHHAGAGTTHAVMASGVPSVPVPHLFDQYYWAGRLHEIGAAPKVMFRHQLNAKKLAARVEEALGRASATAQLGERVRREPGVRAAIEALEAL
jgi:sterol 3beta-glucosyltransferase